MLSQEQYVDNEMYLLKKEFDKIESQKLEYKKEATGNFIDCLYTNFERFERTAEFISCGHYGAGALFYMQKVVGSWVNKRAHYFHLVAALEFGVPKDRANMVYNNLSASMQKKVNDVLQHYIEEIKHEMQQDVS